MVVVPWLLLLPATVLSQLDPHQTWRDRLVTLGFGLNSMRQRIRSVGGTMEIESTAGEGTAISASVPAIVVESR